MGEFQLFREIVSRSVARDWTEAVQEWDLVDIEFAEEAETCLCGHYPIVELCNLRNRQNGTYATVGNCCVKKFMGIRSDLVFDGVRRIAADPNKAMNQAAIDFAFSKGLLDGWERGFLTDTARKRSLSAKQASKRRSINSRVVVALGRVKT